MAREPFQNLTEPMYYILLALMEPLCGVDIAHAAERISGGRLAIGPGTLYTLLAKFEKEHMIQAMGTDGRKRYYQITGQGKQMLIKEYQRLKCLVAEGAPLLEESIREV